MGKPIHATREAWLQAAIKLLSPKVIQHGELPKRLEVLISWPKGYGKNVIGQHFPEAWTQNQSNYITISPTLLDVDLVLATLLHELIHAINVDKAHGPAFKKVALAVGLEGKMRATVASAGLKKELAVMAKQLGAYPHVRMVDLKKPKTAATKNMVRFKSPVDAKYTAWVTPVQYALHGAPLCPICKKPMKEVE